MRKAGISGPLRRSLPKGPVRAREKRERSQVNIVDQEYAVKVMTELQKWFLISLLGSCVLTFSNQLLDHHHHSRFLSISGVVLLFALIAHWKQSRDLSFGLTLTGVILISFTAINGLSIIWANEKAEAVFNAQKWVLMLATYLLFGQLFRNQSFLDISSFLGKVTRILTLLILVVVTYAMVGIVTEQGFSNEALYELKVLFGHKSLTAAFLFLLLPLNLLSEKEESSKWYLWMLVGLQCIMIVLIQSRTVYLSLALFFGIVASYLYKNRADWKPKTMMHYRYLIAGCIVFSFFLLKDPGFRDRLSINKYLKSQTATERQDVWRLTKPLIEEHWLLGVGGGNWKIEFPSNGVEGSYRMQDQNVFFTRAHNDYLEVWAELGLGGVLLYLILFGTVLWRLHQLRNLFPWQARMLLAGILGFMVSSLLDFPKERTEFLVLLAIYLSLIDHLQRQKAIFFLKESYGYLLISAAMVFNLYTGFYRYQGERYTLALMKQRVAGHWEKVLDLSSRAENRWTHLDPYSVPIKYYRGLALYYLQRQEEALVTFKAAHEISPYNFHILNNIATVLLEKKDYQEASHWLAEALRINPRFVDALYNQSYSNSMQGRYSEALEILDSIPESSEKKELYRQEIMNLQRKASSL